jgi:hypothetical protein
LVAPGEPEAMAVAATSILETTSLAAPLDESVLVELRERYGPEATISRYHRLYTELLGGALR